MNARWALAVALLAGACQNGSIDLERMIDQKKYKAYQASEDFADGRAMRTPPAQTVPRDRITHDPARADGIVAGAYVETIPIELDRQVLDQGHDRFDVFCSPCHGIAGDGDSIVANNMPRRPPSLVDPRVQQFQSGYIFNVVTHGYGLMRSYSEDLSIDERWATVAYLRALQMRSGMPFDALPVALRDRAQKELQ